MNYAYSPFSFKELPPMMMDLETEKPSTSRLFSLQGMVAAWGLQIETPPPSMYIEEPSNLLPLQTIYKNGAWYYKPNYKRFKAILRCSKENRKPKAAPKRYIKISL